MENHPTKHRPIGPERQRSPGFPHPPKANRPPKNATFADFLLESNFAPLAFVGRCVKQLGARRLCTDMHCSSRSGNSKLSSNLAPRVCDHSAHLPRSGHERSSNSISRKVSTNHERRSSYKHPFLQHKSERDS
jgi:hypothetical protein